MARLTREQYEDIRDHWKISDIITLQRTTGLKSTIIKDVIKRIRNRNLTTEMLYWDKGFDVVPPIGKTYNGPGSNSNNNEGTIDASRKRWNRDDHLYLWLYQFVKPIAEIAIHLDCTEHAVLSKRTKLRDQKKYSSFEVFKRQMRGEEIPEPLMGEKENFKYQPFTEELQKIVLKNIHESWMNGSYMFIKYRVKSTEVTKFINDNVSKLAKGELGLESLDDLVKPDVIEEKEQPKPKKKISKPKKFKNKDKNHITVVGGVNIGKIINKAILDEIEYRFQELIKNYILIKK